MLRRLYVLAAAVVVAAAALPAAGHGSELIDRNATGVSLAVDDNGQALLTYRARGRVWRVLAWGAVGARQPSASVPQLEFRLDYGFGSRSFANACRPYDGPALALLVAACKAPDGSYWALQSWQRLLPNYGVAAGSTPRELRLSHWRGPTAKLEGWADWNYGGRFHHLFGRFTYGGQPVYGFRSTRFGAPLDGYGRNLYLDTYNSRYGPGWRRENGFLAHRRSGAFCYGFYPHRAGIRGHGDRYRITVIGPGVTPDVRWHGPGLPDYDRLNASHVTLEREMNGLRRLLAANDRYCRD